MKKIVAIFIVVFASLVALPKQAAAQGTVYSVSGVVIDSVTREPLLGVYVTASGRGAQTDRQGRFLINRLPAGEHTLKTMYFSEYGMSERTVCVDRNVDGVVIAIKSELAIDQVIVTGTLTERRLADTPELVTVISSREMAKSGSVSLLETLQDNIPGITFTQNEMGNNMRIRGLNSRYILFMVDGERIVGEGAGGNINFDQINVNNIERVEVINGAASALYGANAVGGVINIITRKPVHRFEAGANASFESNNTWRTGLEAGSVTDKVLARASAFRNTSDGFDKRGVYQARYEDHGGELKLGFKPAARVDLNVTGRFYRHETFNPANSMNVTHSLTDKLTGGFNGGVLSADKRNSLRLSVNFDKYLDYDVFERKGNEKKKKNTVAQLSTRVLDTYTASDRLVFVAGAEYNRNEVFSTMTLGSEPATRSLYDLNGFAQAEWEALRNFDVVAGMRYTYNSQFGDALSPKLALMYELGAFKFRGGVGSAFRAPDIKELYYDFDHGGAFWIYGNPDLKAEKGLYYSLSAEFTKGALNASVAAYYNDIDNKIEQYDVKTTDADGKPINEKYYRNVSRAILCGFDVNVSYTLLRQVTFRCSYGFSDAKDDLTGLQLESNTKHSGTASVTWNGKIARSPFSLQFAGRVHSPKLEQIIGVDETTGEQTVTKRESKTYSIWKVVLVKPFRVRKHTFELTLKADNIFGFRDSSFVNPGRQYMVGVRYNFK